MLSQKIWPKKFEYKKIEAQKFWGPKILFVQSLVKKFRVKNIWGLQKFWGQKQILSQQKFWVEKNFSSQTFWVKNILYLEKYCQKNFLGSIIWGSNRILGPTNFLDTYNWESKNIVVHLCSISWSKNKLVSKKIGSHTLCP